MTVADMEWLIELLTKGLIRAGCWRVRHGLSDRRGHVLITERRIDPWNAPDPRLLISFRRLTPLMSLKGKQRASSKKGA